MIPDLAPRSIEVIRFAEPIKYDEAYALQIARRNEVEQGKNQNALFLLEHPPTITFGRSSHKANLLATPKALKSAGIDIAHIDRGGDITYHGPGQLVAYPILKLNHWQKSVQWYIRSLEDVIIQTLAHHRIDATRMEKFTGVWVDNAKIAAVGIGIHQWVTYHGIAINLNPNPEHWKLIVPCGIQDKPVTSLTQLLENPPTLSELMDTFADEFQRTFSPES